MPRPDRERLEDMLGAARAAVAFGGMLTLDELQADEMTLSAIKYQLVVLDEAASALGQHTKAHAPALPWAQIRGLRNVIAHEYFRVGAGVIHQLVTVDLPELIAALTQLLEEQ